MPSYSPKPTDPGPLIPTNWDSLKSEYNRGYADGHTAGLRACPAPAGQAPCYPCPPSKSDGEKSFSRFLVGIFLGLLLGLLMGLFLGLFISAKVSGA